MGLGLENIAIMALSTGKAFRQKKRRVPLRKKMSLGFRVGNFAIAASYKLAVARISLKQIKKKWVWGWKISR